MKKTRLFAIVISLFLLGSTAVYAAPSKVPAKGLDAALKAHGYPQDLLGRMPEDAKQDLFELNAWYVSHEHGSAYRTDKANPEAPARSSDSTSPGDVSAESLANFSHDMTISKTIPNPTNTEQFFVTYNWTWNYQPDFTLTDQIGIAWGDSWAIDQLNQTVPYKWSYTAKSSRPCDWQQPNYAPRCYDSNTSRTFTGTDYASATPNLGMGFAMDIINGYDAPAPWISSYHYQVESHTGWGRVALIHSVNPPVPGSGNTNVVGQYFHSQFGCNAALGYSYPHSINVVSCSSTTDPGPQLLRTFNW